MTLELDELWSFVAEAEKLVAYAIGDRSQATCRRLWNTIPAAYRSGHCFTDFWSAYQAMVPEEQHTAIGKETGQTAHVERWNNTLRQRLARFGRKAQQLSVALCASNRHLASFSLYSQPAPHPD